MSETKELPQKPIVEENESEEGFSNYQNDSDDFDSITQTQQNMNKKLPTPERPERLKVN